MTAIYQDQVNQSRPDTKIRNIPPIFSVMLIFQHTQPVSYFFQVVVHMNMSPLIVTMVASSDVNIAVLLALSPKVEMITKILLFEFSVLTKLIHALLACSGPGADS